MKLYLTLLFCGFSTLIAQQIKTDRDFGLWTGVGVEWQFKEDYELSFTQEVRLNNSLRKFDNILSDVGFNYKINKNFRIGTDLRYNVNQRRNEQITQDFRYNFDLDFEVDIKKVELNYRLRFQQNFEDLWRFYPKNIDRTSNLRNRIGIQYNYKKMQFYFNAEIFRELVNYRRPYFNEIRLCLGNQIKTRLGEFDVSLAYERELNEPLPLHFIFTRLYYTFKL